MKPQDLLFVIVLVFLLFLRKQKLFVLAGLCCLVIAIPLFAKWVFFTAERLTWYAAGFFLIAALSLLFQQKKRSK